MNKKTAPGTAIPRGGKEKYINLILSQKEV